MERSQSDDVGENDISHRNFREANTVSSNIRVLEKGKLIRLTGHAKQKSIGPDQHRQ